MSLKDKLEDRLLSLIPEGKIRIKAVMLSGKKKNDKSVTGKLKKQARAFEVKELKDWKDAVQMATDPEQPNFQFLVDLYDNLLLDAHLKSVIETRIHRVLRSKFKLVNEAGEENLDLKPLFLTPWFEQFMRNALWSIFTGVKVIELFDLDENLALTKASLIPMQHINPLKGLILIEPGDENGIAYRDGVYAKHIIEIGEPRDLGMLEQLAPLILAKKLAMGSWLDYIQKFGVPGVWITTDNMTEERAEELLEMGLNMLSNNVGVIRGKETVEIGEAPKTDAHKTFQELIQVINSELSKAIVGQDGTTDHKNNTGTYGSLKVLQEVANDRHESDKLFAQSIINMQLIPKLLEISSLYSGLNGYHWEWDESQEMGNSELIDKVVSLTQVGYQIDFANIATKTGIPITGFQPNGNTSTSAEEPPSAK